MGAIDSLKYFPPSIEQTTSLKYWDFLYHTVYTEPQTAGFKTMYTCVMTTKVGGYQTSSYNLSFDISPPLLIKPTFPIPLDGSAFTDNKPSFNFYML